VNRSLRGFGCIIINKGVPFLTKSPAETRFSLITHARGEVIFVFESLSLARDRDAFALSTSASARESLVVTSSYCCFVTSSSL